VQFVKEMHILFLRMTIFVLELTYVQTKFNMKRVLFIAILFVMAVLSASAQAPTLQRYGRFLTMNGSIIPDEEMRYILSEDVYNDTYVGARKQLETARKIRTYSIIGAGVGAAGIIGGTIGLALSDTTSDYVEGETDIHFTDSDVANLLLLTSGITLFVAGTTGIGASIAFEQIGRRRLDWVAEDYNSGNHASKVRLDLGAQDHGFGLALKF